MFKITAKANDLTDGRRTYDVILSDHETPDSKSRAVMAFHAVTGHDAFDLVLKLRDALAAHTNDEVQLRTGTGPEPYRIVCYNELADPHRR